jgi:hypothetical protein
MKKPTTLIILLCTLFLVNCSTDEVLNTENTVLPNFRVYESDGTMNRDSVDDPCMVVDLIAGQHTVAGTLSIDVNENDLILIYRTSEDWLIYETHMSIGDCDVLTFPTTGAGNPKIGRFEHSTSHSDGVNEVIYYINKEAVSDIYCFAAHAVVVSASGSETAWAEGIDFGGNSWAMYVEANKSDCNVVNDGECDPGDPNCPLK